MMDATDAQIAAFSRMVKSGESPRLAEMLALRKPPKADTDDVHFQGMGMAHLAKVAGHDYAKNTYGQAKAAGLSITDSHIYNGSIADKRKGGDPKAWIGPGDGRAKFRNVIKARGASCETLGIDEGPSDQVIETYHKKKEWFNNRKRKIEAIEAEVADKKKD